MGNNFNLRIVRMKQVVARDSGRGRVCTASSRRGTLSPCEMEEEARPKEKGSSGNRISSSSQRTRQLHGESGRPSLSKSTSARREHRRAPGGTGLTLRTLWVRGIKTITATHGEDRVGSPLRQMFGVPLRNTHKTECKGSEISFTVSLCPSGNHSET